jgi:hypothetical protein
MREAILMLSLMVMVMLVVHFKMITRANVAATSAMVSPQSEYANTQGSGDGGGLADATH